MWMQPNRAGNCLYLSLLFLFNLVLVQLVFLFFFLLFRFAIGKHKTKQTEKRRRRRRRRSPESRERKNGTMSAVNVTNVSVLDNPSMFLNPFQFEIAYECLIPLSEGQFLTPKILRQFLIEAAPYI